MEWLRNQFIKKEKPQASPSPDLGEMSVDEYKAWVEENYIDRTRSFLEGVISFREAGFKGERHRFYGGVLVKHNDQWLVHEDPLDVDSADEAISRIVRHYPKEIREALLNRTDKEQS